MTASRDPGDFDSRILKPLDEKDESGLRKSLKKKPEPPQVELDELHRDLAIAGQIQSRLLPERIPKVPGYDFEAFYLPAGEIGGDFYDFIPFDRNRLGILVADASGKGIVGSLLMVEARAVVRAMASVSASPVDILRKTNRVLHQDLKRGMFITMFFALLDFSKGRLTVASAGHTPMLFWRRRTGLCYAVNPSGLVLGAADEETFSRTLREEGVTLQPGDRFVLTTDGVTEGMNARSVEFGMSGLLRCTLENAGRTSADYLQALLGSIERHRGGAAVSDDVTIVTARLLSEEEIW